MYCPLCQALSPTGKCGNIFLYLSVAVNLFLSRVWYLTAAQGFSDHPGFASFIPWVNLSCLRQMVSAHGGAVDAPTGTAETFTLTHVFTTIFLPYKGTADKHVSPKQTSVR